MARVLAETSDAGDSELRTMALEALGRQDEARRSLHATPVAALVPVWASIARALLALVDRSPDAAAAFAELAAAHTDPEALFMYAACQARVGDTARAHSTLVASVEGGFTVPQALREHPWLAPLREAPSFGPLVERAEAARRVAERDFREAGGPALLGT
jgi:hypothetical protein